MTGLIGFLWMVAFFPFVAHATAADPAPFFIWHQSPLLQSYGLPAAEGGKLVEAGHLDGRLVLNVANSFSGGSAPGEGITLDGETLMALLVLRYGGCGRWEFGIDLPYLSHDDGRFDDLINFFHDLTGLSSDARRGVGARLKYRYARNGVDRILLTEESSGIGDLRFSLGYQLLRGREAAGRSLALRAGLKLPTGEAEDLQGTGSTDFSLRLELSDAETLAGWNLTLFGSGGVLLMTDGDLIEEQQRHIVGFGTAGFNWQALRWLAFKLQADLHSPFYRDSDFRELSSWATQLTGGFAFTLPGEVVLDFGISENVLVETAPDVVFHLSLRRRF